MFCKINEAADSCCRFRFRSYTTLASNGNELSRKRDFSTLVPGSDSFQLHDLAGFSYGLGLGFWVVFHIAITLTIISTITVILP